jgi:cellulose synthase/poly-beta-1,6-N-acetylglucosamine synthase-like glycosyltransferase
MKELEVEKMRNLHERKMAKRDMKKILSVESEIKMIWLTIKNLISVIIIAISALLYIDMILYSMISDNTTIGLLSLMMFIPILIGLKMYASTQTEIERISR